MMKKENCNALFTIAGAVQKGNGKGNTMGFPTANLSCDSTLPSGIYAGEAVWNAAAYPAALYKGNEKPVIEAHLLDFSGNLYGEKLTLRAYQRIRDVKTFHKKEDLVAAIARDISEIKKLCSRK